MYLEKWNRPDNLIEQNRLNSNFPDKDEINELNNYISRENLNKQPVKVKEYSEGHNILTLELPYFVLICECCFSLSLDFYAQSKAGLKIKKSRFRGHNAFAVTFGKNSVYCEMLEVRTFFNDE